MDGSPMQAECAPLANSKMAAAVAAAPSPLKNAPAGGPSISHREDPAAGVSGEQQPPASRSSNKNKKTFYRRRNKTHHSSKRGVSGSGGAVDPSWAHRREEARRRRAAVRRQSLGQPVAPYNTTQFLMEEHKQEVDEQMHHHRRRGDSFNSVDSFGEDYQSSSVEDDDEYLQAQFCAEYDSVASERLHAMSKPELVHEFLLLEARIGELENELKAVQRAEESDQPMEVQATEEDIAKINVFQREIARLQATNRRLTLENDHLHAVVARSSGTMRVTTAAGGRASNEQDEEGQDQDSAESTTTAAAGGAHLPNEHQRQEGSVELSGPTDQLTYQQQDELHEDQRIDDQQDLEEKQGSGSRQDQLQAIPVN